MDYFILKEDVFRAIDYFQEEKHDELLYLFLLLKHMGISDKRELKLSGSGVNKMSLESKEEILRAFEQIGGIRDEIETFNKFAVLFPSGFADVYNSSNDSVKRSAFFQPGSTLPQFSSRLRDTLKNIRRDKFFVYEETNATIKLIRDYEETITEVYLRNRKLSLRHLAAWLYRFTAFPFNLHPSPVEFSRVIRKSIRNYFRLTDKEFEWLVDDDLSLHVITPSLSKISGKEVRQYLSIESFILQENDYELTNPQAPTRNNRLNADKINEYREITGANPTYLTIKQLLLEQKQIILTGVPGVGKSFYSKKLANDKDNYGDNTFEQSWVIQFHERFTYEDFIGGETIAVDPQTGSSVVTPYKGKLFSAIQVASEQPDKKFLFIIDEINRGNVSSIFGETILLLDREYSVELPRAIDGISTLQLPENLYLIGTMNTSDRNIAFVDLAIRRRFGFVELHPNSDYLSEVIELTLDGFPREGTYNVGGILDRINANIIKVLIDKNLRLGQSYFIPKDGNKWEWKAFQNQFNYVVLPTIREYSYSRIGAAEMILGDQLTDGIQELSLFKDAFYNQFSEMVIWK